MDLTTIILVVLNFIFGGTTLWGLVTSIRYRKENKEIKKAEASRAKVDVQKEEINLANLYKNEVLKMIDQLKSSNTNQEKMLEKLDQLDNRMDSMEARMGTLDTRMGNVETFLNGEYRQWKEQHAEKPKTTRRKTAKKEEE